MYTGIIQSHSSNFFPVHVITHQPVFCWLKRWNLPHKSLLWRLLHCRCAPEIVCLQSVRFPSQKVPDDLIRITTQTPLSLLTFVSTSSQFAPPHKSTNRTSFSSLGSVHPGIPDAFLRSKTVITFIGVLMGKISVHVSITSRNQL